MIIFYVYLRLVENQLIITANKDNNNNSVELMHADGNLAINNCKMFCIGFIYGAIRGGSPVVNSAQEFV